MIRATGVVKTFGRVVTLDSVSLEVGEGEVVAVSGPSGSGKTTLLRCLNGLETVTSGEIEVGGRLLVSRLPGAPGREIARDELRRLRAQVGMVFQRFNLFPHMTALENVMAGPLRVLGLPRPPAEAQAMGLLERVGLERRARHFPAQLSGGEQQRVAIARALAVRPRALLCDEVTSALDPESVGGVLQVLRDLAREGMTMVIVTHEIHFARAVADRAVVMDRGSIIEEGPTGVVLYRPREARVRAFLQRVLERERE